jgi:Ca2+/H+ antiporter
VVLSVVLRLPLELGLGHDADRAPGTDHVAVGNSLASGRATVLHGAMHLVVFGAFLVQVFVP